MPTGKIETRSDLNAKKRWLFGGEERPHAGERRTGLPMPSWRSKKDASHLASRLAWLRSNSLYLAGYISPASQA